MPSTFVLTLRMVKIEHSVFALPFAYTGLFLAAGGWPGWGPLLVLTLAMVAVRSFAMAANRILDLAVDRKNPRTQDRPLVTGALSRRYALVFTGGCAVVFVAATAFSLPHESTWLRFDKASSGVPAFAVNPNRRACPRSRSWVNSEMTSLVLPLLLAPNTACVDRSYS